jgi:hypothetical protein
VGRLGKSYDFALLTVGALTPCSLGRFVSRIPSARGRFVNEISAARRCSRSTVERAPYAKPAAIENVGADHGRGDILGFHQLPDRPNVGPRLEKVRGKRMVEGMGTDALGDAGGDRGLSHCSLDGGFVQVMAPA